MLQSLQEVKITKLLKKALRNSGMNYLTAIMRLFQKHLHLFIILPRAFDYEHIPSAANNAALFVVPKCLFLVETVVTYSKIKIILNLRLGHIFMIIRL